MATEDSKYFGEKAFVYCNQHLAPHKTGWCTVSIRNKTKLDATDITSAYKECKEKGFTLYTS